MEKIVGMIVEKTGISEEHARIAVNTVVSYLKDKMPGGLGKQVESYIHGDGDDESGASGLGDKLGGIL